MARRPFVAGNWKMHGSSVSNQVLLAAALADGKRCAGVDVAVCVPFPYLAQAAGALKGSGTGLGAQDVSEHASGAYTGEVSSAMLADLGCTHVIVGHSERRSLHGESDALVARKFVRAMASTLKPILCVGETLAEREAGQTEVVVLRQLQAVVQTTSPESWAHAVLAYEPVWAIGTGRTASAQDAQAVHARLRAALAMSGAPADAIRIVYGGSVKPGNAGELFSMPDIDGGLIGGASLVADDFSAICDAAQRTH